MMTNQFRFRSISPGIETLHSNFSLPRHRHLHAYATVVLDGCFDESGYIGRIRATAGDVLIHPALDCHANEMVCAGLRLVRLDWPDHEIGGLYTLKAVDEFAGIAKKDLRSAPFFLRDTLREGGSQSGNKKNDWPDLLAQTLVTQTNVEIGAWSEANGLSPETVSRGFASAYGITPTVFRAEVRTRAAWLRITQSSDSLCTIAAETGFADQAHMTRWIHRVSGAPPNVWRTRLAALSTRRMPQR